MLILPPSDYELNDKWWTIVSKVLKFVNGGNIYFKRLIDDESVWLYNDRLEGKFKRYRRPLHITDEVAIVR